VRALPVHELYWPVHIDGRKVNARVMGVTPDYFRTFPAKLKSGRMLCDLDSAGLRTACLLGLPLPAEIARGKDVMAMHVSIGDTSFSMAGLVAPEARSVEEAAPTQAAGRVDIYVPYQTAIRRYGTRSVRFEQGQREAFQVEVDEAVLELEDPLNAAPAVQAILKKGHTREDYEVVVPLQMLRQKQRTQDIFNLVMVLISGLTLLVGGIGIVNIMLVSATERTKEIGIRRALGARRRDIMFQFLVETVALTLTGGLLGCAAGAAGVLAIARYTGWPVVITPGALFTSILVSAGAGVLFGLYPARKASRVNPVFALRCE
jgi:putative ABC transport system permease protein